MLNPRALTKVSKYAGRNFAFILNWNIV